MKIHILVRLQAENVVKELFDYLSLKMFIENTHLLERQDFTKELLLMVTDRVRAKFDTGNGTHASMFHVDKIDVKGKTVKWEKDGKKFTSKLEGESQATQNEKI